MLRLREKPSRLKLLLNGLPSIGPGGVSRSPSSEAQFVDMLLNGDMTDTFDDRQP